MVTRRRYPPDIKSKVALEMVRKEKTKAQLASGYGIQPNLWKQWRNLVIERLPTLFTDEQRAIEKLKDGHGPR